MSRTLATLTCGAALFLASVLHGQNLPAMHASAIDGRAVEIPSSGAHNPMLLMVGFSHKASKQFDLWKQHGFSKYLKDNRIDCLELVDMHGVPGFAVSMARHGMRKEIHGEEQSHFVTFESDDNVWKKLVGYEAPEDAYLVLAAADGHVVWQTHGAPDDRKAAELQRAIAQFGVVTD